MKTDIISKLNAIATIVHERCADVDRKLSYFQLHKKLTNDKTNSYYENLIREQEIVVQYYENLLETQYDLIRSLKCLSEKDICKLLVD